MWYSLLLYFQVEWSSRCWKLKWILHLFIFILVLKANQFELSKPFSIISYLLGCLTIHLFFIWALYLLTTQAIGLFGGNWSFSSMPPRVAKGRQRSPRVSKVQGEPQGWVRWVITRSIIFKSFSYMIFKIGPFPHWNPPKSPLKTKIFPDETFYCL